MIYMSNKMEATLLQLVQNMHIQYGKNTFDPMATEVTFGPNKGHDQLIGPSWKLNTKNKNRIDVNGKIDRIDMIDIDGVKYLVVIDYKSSNKTFDLPEFKNGISMQMPTYFWSLNNNLNKTSLDKILNIDSNESTLVGGALYEHITNPRINPKTWPTDEKAITDGILANFQMNGMLLDNFDLKYKFDTTLEPVEHKATKKKPAYTSLAASQVIDRNGKKTLFTEDELADILKYNNRLIEKAGEQIYSGNIKLNPYRHNQKSALQYTDFKPIFQFDAMLDENEYHDIVDDSKKDILESIRNVLNEGINSDGKD